MDYNSKNSDYRIRGSCSLFACRCCRTKYGWKHQEWCELYSVTQPFCGDCRYFKEGKSSCAHPATNRIRKEEGAV